MGRFHAHFRRSRPAKGQNNVMLKTKGTPGVYVGAVISALPLHQGGWREGVIRFFMDADTERPTITGTGWPDWFLSAWGLGPHQSLYAGCNYQVRHPEFGDRYFCSCHRFHAFDPIYFQRELRVEHQQLGFFGHPGEKGYQHAPMTGAAPSTGIRTSPASFCGPRRRAKNGSAESPFRIGSPLRGPGNRAKTSATTPSRIRAFR